MKKYDNDRLMKYKEFYDEIHKKVKKYKKTISTIGFGLPEVDKLSKLEEDITGTINAVEVIINSSLELNHIFESSPDSIYVTDGEGITLRVNKAFEESAISKRQEVMRENVYDLERRGVFKPSVCGLILKEKRKISILQNMDSGK
ncbi:MAG: PAS domain-containing protein, partial [Clostridia bacterium]|nr:PAS domain-containing protein [Clostridia bacterium]